MSGYSKQDMKALERMSMLQTMAIHDINGRCRCQWCGRFRRPRDFLKQSGHITLGNRSTMIHMHVAPACRKCMEKKK